MLIYTHYIQLDTGMTKLIKNDTLSSLTKTKTTLKLNVKDNIIGDIIGDITGDKELSMEVLTNCFYKLYENMFICVNNELYHYNGVYWKNDPPPHSDFHVFLKDKYYDDLLSSLLLLENCNGGSSQKIKFIEKTLKTNKHRKDLIDEILHLIKKNIKFDNNPYLFAFNNKIFDFEKNTFQEHNNPKDYITITTGYDYDDNYDDVKIKNLINILNQIFPNDEIKDFYMTILVSGLCGIHVQHLISAVGTGTGGNGKSVVNDLMMSLCGNYAYELSSSTLFNLSKKGHNSDFINLHNKRFVKVSEINTNKKVCTNIIRELIGKNSSDILLKLTLVLESNKVCQFDDETDTILKKNIIAPFESSFVTKNMLKYKKSKANADTDTGVNVFEKNVLYTEESWKNDHKQALFEILRNYYKIFKENRIVVPTCITKKEYEHFYIKKENIKKENNAKEEEDKYKKQHIPASLKRQVWSKHVGTEKGVADCLCCGVIQIHKDSFSCGHIIAESKGGKMELNNLKPICFSCNSSIGTMNMNEFIEFYKLNKNIKNINNCVTEYYCIPCKYHTDITTNFKKHLASQSHAKISGENTTDYTNIRKRKIYCCNWCDSVFTSNQSLKNHKNTQH